MLTSSLQGRTDHSCARDRDMPMEAPYWNERLLDRDEFVRGIPRPAHGAFVPSQRCGGVF